MMGGATSGRVYANDVWVIGNARSLAWYGVNYL
jgi:hypothetical protein